MTEQESTATPEGPQDGERRAPVSRLFGTSGSFWGLTARIGALVGVLTSIVSFFVLVRPFWDGEETKKQSATLSALDLERLTFRQYLDEVELSHTPYAKKQLGRPGVFAQFHVEITGFRGKSLPLRWQLLDERSDIVRQDSLVSLEPHVDEDSGDWSFWAELPRRPGSFRIRVRLYRPERLLPLTRIESKPFPGASRSAAASAAE